MKILKDKWLPRLNEHSMFLKSNPSMYGISDREREITLDFKTSHDMMIWSEVIIFPNDVFTQLLKNIDRIDTRGEIYLPYPWIMIQLEEPIPESLMMKHKEDIGEPWEEDPRYPEWRNPHLENEDMVEALLIGNPEQDPTFDHKAVMATKRHCVALFSSSSVNRVAWVPGEKESVPWWEKPPVEIKPEQEDNKARLIKLAYLANLFFNAPNVVLHSIKVPKVIQMKRERKKKKLLPEYHTVEIKKTAYEQSETRQKGAEHSHMYPVRGHFRRIKGCDNPIWIPNHFRGVKHGEESIPKEIYKVKNPKEIT